MKYLMTASLAALACLSAPAFAQDDATRTSTTTVQQGDGSYSVSTTRAKTDTNGDTVNVNTNVDANADGNASVSKHVERNSTDIYGNQTKEVVDHTADSTGKRTDTRYDETTTNPQQ